MKVTNFSKFVVFLLIININIIYSTADGFTIINMEINAINSENAIFINNSFEFMSLAQQEGWMGNGTLVSPYIIANKYINVSGERIISINNTDLYFQIENCTLVGAGVYLRNVTNAVFFNNTIIDEPKGQGIYMENCVHTILSLNNFSRITLVNTKNGIISNNTINDIYGGYRITLDMCSNLEIISNVINKFNPGNQLKDGWDLADNFIFTEGITVKGSSDITLLKNKITNCDNGVTVKNSEMISITNNSIKGIDDKGILLIQTQQSSIKNNEVERAFFGVAIQSASHNNDISNNFLRSISCDGIYISGSQDNYIFKNEIYCSQPFYVAEGIFLHSAKNNIVEANIIHQCWIGIMLNYATTNVISNNIITNSDTEGIWIHLSSNDNEIGENKIYNNDNGIMIEDCNNNNVSKNEISKNLIGIYLKNANYNSITKNNISNNWGTGVFLESSNGNTILENIFYGNFGNDIEDSEGNVVDTDGNISPGWRFSIFFPLLFLVVILTKKRNNS